MSAVDGRSSKANGRVAMLSGASRGIGAAIARELAVRGWKLSLGMREPVLPEWADGSNVHLFRYEAADTGAAARWVADAGAFHGHIDAVIANAGIMIPRSVIAAEDADLDQLFEINVKAPRRLVKAAWEELTVAGSGRVMILASLSGKRVKSAKSGSYAVSKFAAVALSHAIRQAGWDLGIRATAICPGFVATDMAHGITDLSDSEMTKPDDLAVVIATLLDLPNEASVAEFTVNCQLEEFV
ncbi:MAG: SDR family NAD(P)-dependent oxidoreductase [Rhizobiaceae bacterium]|jgi:NADP-dependent 3-hydroxy acid dehydrogenase YdfG